MSTALIGAAPRVEHYEMAGYGTVRSIAKTLGPDDQVSPFAETFEEEKETDKKLAELVSRSIFKRTGAAMNSKTK